MITNAIKFSHPREALQIQFRFLKSNDQAGTSQKPLDCKLETKIVNFGTKFELKKN